MGVLDKYIQEYSSGAIPSPTPPAPTSTTKTTVPSVSPPTKKEDEEEEKKPTFWERIKNIGKAGTLQTGGSYVAAGATAADATSNRRSATLAEAQSVTLDNYRKELENELGIINAYETGTTYHGQTFTREEYEDALDMAENLQFYVDAMSPAYDAAQKSSSEFGSKAQEEASFIINEGAEAQAEAKDGLGTVGSFLVDAGVAGVQMAGDALIGVASSGSSTGAMLIRSFGSGANSAAQQGGDTNDQIYEGAKSAALEYFSEKLFGGNPIYDDGGLVTDLLFKAADRFGGSKTLTNILSSLPAKMASEGLEEVVSAVLDPVVNRVANWIDKGSRNTDMPDVNELLREGLIGAALSGVANVVTGNVGKNASTQNKTEAPEEAQTAQNAAETSEAAKTKTDTPATENAVKLDAEPVTEPQTATPEPFDPVKSLAGVQTPPQTISQPSTETAIPSATLAPDYGNFDPVTALSGTSANRQTDAQTEAPVTTDMEQIVLDAIKNGEPIRTAPVDFTKGQTPEAAAQPIADTTAYDQMIASTPESRLLPVGENPARDFRAPIESAGGNLESRSFRAVGEAETTSPQMAAVLKTGFAESLGAYVGDTNRAQVDRAVQSVQKFGYHNSVNTFLQTAESGKVDADTVALGAVLIKAASDSGATENFLELYKAYSRLATAAGQAVQAQRIYKRLNSVMEGFVAQLTPVDRLSIMQDSVIAYNEDLQKRFPNGVPLRTLSRSSADAAREEFDIRTGAFRRNYAMDYEISMDPELAKQFMKAETDKQRDDISKKILADLASQAPSTWQEKLSAWRYFAMLFNPRTHVKNIVSNTLTVPVRWVKNMLRAGLEFTFIKDPENRTRAVLNRNSPSDHALITHAKILYGEVESDIMSTGKWTDAGLTAIDQAKPVFNRFSLLEKASSFNTKALSEEDRWFSQPAFTTAFAADCKAHGITAADIQSGKVDKATIDQITQRAVEASRKATFREMSQLADFMNRITTVRPGDKAFTKAAKSVAGVIFPFRSTPANITTQALEYSPIGLGKSIWDMCTKVHSGDMSAAQAIDEFAAGFTGTALMAIGVFLGRHGLLTGGEDDDQKQQEFNELQGWQGYSIHVGDTYYSIENMGIGVIPLLVGVELNRILSSEYETTLSGTLDAMSNITDPIFEMTMLSSVTDLLEELSYANGHYLKTIASSVARNFVSQLFPTLGGAVERVMENQVYSTFTDRTEEAGRLQGMNDAQYGLGTILNKIPGVEYNQIPRLDAWGRTKDTGAPLYRAFTNFLSPGYISSDVTAPVDEELQRLYDTGLDHADEVFPDKASQSVKVNGHYLTADEYVEYQSTMGGTSLSLLQEIIGGDTWKGLTDAERIDITNTVYDYARAQAQRAVDSSTAVDSWITDEDSLRIAYGMSRSEYVIAYARYGKVFLDSDATKAVVSAGGDMDAFFRAMEAISDLPKAPERSNVLAWQKMVYMSNHDFPEAAKEAYYKEIMNSDNTYDEWLTAKENGYTMQEWAAGHYDSYVPGALYVTGGLGSGSQSGGSLSDFISAYGLIGG